MAYQFPKDVELEAMQKRIKHLETALVAARRAADAERAAAELARDSASLAWRSVFLPSVKTRKDFE